jgi:hypothetical protein
MIRKVKISLISLVFLIGLSTLTLTGCSSSSSTADEVPKIDGMTPGDYNRKLQKESMKHAGKSGRKSKKHR